MDRKKKTLNLIIEQGILPFYFHPDADVSIQILKALYNAGIRVVEYENRGEIAIDNFLRLRSMADKELPGIQIGAGTIRNKIEATEFINEGANFVICPGVIEAVGTLTYKNDLLWVPGCLTPSEIIIADELGAQLIKLFPGKLLGPSYLASIKEIFPGLLFMPAGGLDIKEEYLKDWFKSGASAVGLGSTLVSTNLVESRDYAGIESQTRQTLQYVQSVRYSKR